MSSNGALIVALSALVVLGGFGAWLVNVPLWSVAGLVVLGAVLIGLVFRRISRRNDRQNTET